MKKLLLVVALVVLAAGFAFAQDEFAPAPAPAQAAPAQAAQPAPAAPRFERFNMEFSFGFPVHWSNGKNDTDFYWQNIDMQLDKTITSNTAFGLSFVTNFNRTFGIALETDFFFNGRVGAFARPNSDSLSVFGANAFFGPVIYLFNNDSLKVPLGIGAHFYYFADEVWVPPLYDFTGIGQWMSRRDMQFGPALSIGIQYHFDRTLYMFSKTNVAIDLFRSLTIEGYADLEGNGIEYTTIKQAGRENNWLVKPTIGLGIKW